MSPSTRDAVFPLMGGACFYPRARTMRKSRPVNLLIVDGNGTRVIRLSFPRRIVLPGLILSGLAVCSLGAILGDYVSLKRQGGQTAALQRQVAEQRALIGSFHKRIAGVLEEVSSWRDLQAQIWEAFGPAQGSPPKARGIGGGNSARRVAFDEPVALSTDLDLLSASVSEEGQSLRALTRFLAKAGKALAALPSRWPARGGVNSEFGRRLSPWSGRPEFHSGLDIAAPLGTPVRATAPGTVILAGSKADYGNTVIIDHGQKIKSLYGHLQKIQVAPGQRVQRGQQIALSGDSGRSTGPHLHYEVMVRGQRVNPRSFLWD